MAIHTVKVSDFQGEHNVVLASSNGYKFLRMLTLLTESGSTSVKFQVVCKGKVELECFPLELAVEFYNKVDAG